MNTAAIAPLVRTLNRKSLGISLRASWNYIVVLAVAAVCFTAMYRLSGMAMAAAGFWTAALCGSTYALLRAAQHRRFANVLRVTGDRLDGGKVINSEQARKVVRERLRQREQAMHELAKETTYGSALHGSYQGREYTVHNTRQNFFSGWLTIRVEVASYLKKALEETLTITRWDNNTEAGGLLLKTGDASFDREFRVYSYADEAAVRGLLNERARGVIGRLALGPGINSVTIRDRKVALELTSDPADAVELTKQIKTIIDLSEAIDG